MSKPDVSVVVPVYNTMPYLTKCLTSLVEQSIGRDRMQIVAVDDGSTDGSGRQLDRFARRYPDLFTVIHQSNSGGPAAPLNRGLEVATGRYVFFIGSDDYLGPEALERMVTMADQYGSDVLVGKLVGVNGRYVHQPMYATNQADVSLFDSPLPWALSNTKLFRRELIEEHGLRYPEDMPVGSDQPFTLEALFRAKRISVLADYDVYHAVRRFNAGNITYRAGLEERLRCTKAIMDVTARFVAPGPQRDAINVRHFTWEVGKLLKPSLLDLDRPVQERIRAGIADLAAQHFTDAIRDQLEVPMRVRISLAQRGALDELLAVIRQDAEQGGPPVVVDGGRIYAGYPCFRDARLSLPDSLFDVTNVAADYVAKQIYVTSVMWRVCDGARTLVVTAQSPRSDLSSHGPVQMTVGEVPGEVTVDSAPGGSGTRLQARFKLDRLLAACPAEGARQGVRVQFSAFGTTCDAPLRAAGVSAASWLRRRRARLYRVAPTINRSGKLVIAIAPVTVHRVVGRLRRVRLQGGK